MKNNINMFLKGIAGRLSATVVLFALGCFSAFAGNNTVKIEDFVTAPGQTTTLEILLENEDPISSLEMLVTLPEGLKYKDNSLAKVTSRVTRSSHSIGVKDEGADGFRIIMLSTSSTIENSPVKGNSGAILTIDVVASNSYKGGDIVISDIIGSDQTNKDENGKYVPKRIDMEAVTVKAGVHVGDATADDAELTAAPGMIAKVGVSLDNVINIVGLQAVVTLPEGVSFAEDENGEKVTYGDRLSDNTTVTIEPLEGQPGSYTLVVSSLTSDVFTGTSGNLFALNLAAAEGFTKGDVTISDIKVSSVNGMSYSLEGTLTTTLYGAGDPTRDGVWDIDDVYAVIEMITTSGYDATCDLNGDDVVDIDDLYLAIEKIME